MNTIPLRMLGGLVVAGATALGPLVVTTPVAAAAPPAPGVAALEAAADPVPTCSGGSCTTTYASTGAVQTFEVPAGVREVTVVLTGGSGGDWAARNTVDDSDGGLGGRSAATVATTPGDVMSLVVGGAGTSARFDGPIGGSPGGNGGGGSGGAGFEQGGGTPGGAGGGGGTFLLSDDGLLLAAGGGGGGGGTDDLPSAPGFGGGGGGGAGVPATPGQGGGTSGGGAGTPAAHGSGGTGDGGFGEAGTSGSGTATSPDSLPTGGSGGAGYPAGAGGGGGYFAGGGGGGVFFGNSGAGGGGAGYAAPGLTDVTGASGTHEGDGTASITWVAPIEVDLVRGLAGIGQRQRAVASGLGAGEKVRVVDDGRRVSPGSARANRRGVYRLGWKVTGPRGRHQVVVTGVTSDRAGRDSYRVVRR